MNVIPVREFINAQNWHKQDWGVDGYNFPTFNYYNEKSRAVKIYNNKKKTFLDDYVKLKSQVPPAQYETI